MPRLRSHLRFALRSLRVKPVFTAVAIGSLALGIGANTAIFSVVESALLRPLPFQHPEQLVMVRDHQTCCDMASLSPGEYLDYHAQSKTFQDVAAISWQELTLSGCAEATKIHGSGVTTNFFQVLGARAQLGRLMSEKVDKAGADSRVAVISDRLWRGQFGADPNILGRTLALNSNSFRVIGVLAPKQEYPSESDIWVSPRLLVPEYVEDRLKPGYDVTQQYGNHWMIGLGRLKPGVSASVASAELKMVAANIARVHNDDHHAHNDDHYAVVFALQDSLVAKVRPALWVLLAAVVLLLLIACSNLAGLLLARASSRTRELAIRVSVGASGWEIVRLLLTESLVLAVGGGALGIATAVGAMKLIVHYSPYDLPASMQPSLNLPVLLFSIALTLAAALLSGIIPSVQASQMDINSGLKEGSKGTVSGSSHRLRQVLVGAEVALSVVLLIGAGLLIRSFSRLVSVHPGFDPKNVLTATVTLPLTRYSHDQGNQFWDKLLARMQQIPAVEKAALTTALPFTDANSGTYIGSKLSHVDRYAINVGMSPDSFAVLRMPILQGRSVNERDVEKAPSVAVVNQELARQLFPGQNPIGLKFYGPNPPEEGPTTIVGVVPNVKRTSLDEDPHPEMYFNYPQYGANSVNVILRTSTPESAIVALRGILHNMDPNLALSDINPLENYIGESLASRRFLLGLLTTFSALAMVLAAIGLYAIIAFSVQQRTQEIGIRVALGANHPGILWLILRESLAIAVVGAGAGLLGADWCAGLLKTMLYGVTSSDPGAYASAVGLILAVTLFASLIPAFRATRVDPLTALRYE